jgi:hemoglobin
MSRRPNLVLALTLFVVFVMAAGAPALQAQPAPSLYDRLGGYSAISAVVDDFADRLFADPKVGRFFVGMGSDTREMFKQKNKNLICSVTGGPCKVISRPAKTVHAGLGITGADFDVVAGHLVAVLNKFKVPAGEKKELLDIIASLRPDIVER